jgi:digeranylgeranylglycerophospholipid reductase
MIGIVGGGPVGNYLASLLKEECVIYEEHDKVGKPIQCTGILTDDINKLIKVKKSTIVNEISKIRLNAGGENYKFSIKEKEIIVNREKFDNSILDLALKNGVKVKHNKNFRDFKDNKIIFEDRSSEKVNILVGADGHKSHVARKTGLWQDRKFWRGIQIKAEIDNLEKDTYDVFFDACPDFFGWCVPENDNVARIGLGTLENAGEHWKKFIKRFDVKKILCYESGPIPIWKKINLRKDNVYLVGDAGLQLKNISGGGIVPGMKGAKVLADCLNNGKDYEKEIKKLNKELWFSDYVRRKLNKLDVNKYEELIKILRDVDLGKYNRDEPFGSLGIFVNLKLAKFGIKNFLF